MLFGGDSSGQIYGDTWTWRAGWHPTSPATSPSARSGPAMAYDGAAGNIVLFGGVNSAGTALSDTWTWDGNNWTQEFPAASPPGRQFDLQGMAYDAATQTVVLFGGFDSGLNALGDTWTWDGKAKTWIQQFPASSPSPRRAPIAYDDVTRTVVLVGGDKDDGQITYNDTWTWDGITWTQQFPASAPSARSSASIAFDAHIGAVILFGGYGPWPDVLTDTWAWNGTTWMKISPATVPPDRYSAGMDYDPVNKAVLMFGGYSSTVVRSDTWLLALAP